MIAIWEFADKVPADAYNARRLVLTETMGNSQDGPVVWKPSVRQKVFCFFFYWFWFLSVVFLKNLFKAFKGSFVKDFSRPPAGSCLCDAEKWMKWMRWEEFTGNGKTESWLWSPLIWNQKLSPAVQPKHFDKPHTSSSKLWTFYLIKIIKTSPFLLKWLFEM